MASDTVVHWKNKRPKREEAEAVIQKFFDGAATEIRWEKDRFFVTLIGKWSHPLSGVLESEDLRPLPPTDPGWEGRYLEVWLSKGSLDVITRQQDEFTNNCARGLAKVFARFWEGELEDD